MLTVNGQSVTLEEHVRTVEQLLMHYKLNPDVVIVEMNGQIVDKTRYAETILHDGDKLELVHFVGGG